MSAPDRQASDSLKEQLAFLQDQPEEPIAPKRDAEGEGSGGRSLVVLLIIAAHVAIGVGTLHLVGVVTIPGVPRFRTQPAVAVQPPAQPPKPAATPKPLSRRPVVSRSMPVALKVPPKPQPVAETPQSEPAEPPKKPPARLVAERVSPEAVIKDCGLTKSGILYVLGEEDGVLQKLKSVRVSFGQFEGLYAQLAGFFTAEAEWQQLWDERAVTLEQLRDLDAQLDVMPQRGNSMIRENFQNAKRTQLQLRTQVNAYDRGIALGRKLLPAPGQKDKVARLVEEQRAEFLRAVDEIRPLFDAVLKRYEQIEGDPKFKKALESVRQETHAQVQLGPSPEFTRGLKDLNSAEKAARGASQSAPGRKKGARAGR